MTETLIRTDIHSVCAGWPELGSAGEIFKIRFQMETYSSIKRLRHDLSSSRLPAVQSRPIISALCSSKAAYSMTNVSHRLHHAERLQSKAPHCCVEAVFVYVFPFFNRKWYQHRKWWLLVCTSLPVCTIYGTCDWDKEAKSCLFKLEENVTFRFFEKVVCVK